MRNYSKDHLSGNIIRTVDGVIMRFSFNSFVDRIVKGDTCFICGMSPKEKPFNNEHVIPKWILKNYTTPEAFMVLPNQTTIKNTSYVVPCCQDCNTELGSIIEKPISKLLKQPYEEIIKILSKEKSLNDKLFQWLCLLFFKTHLKDSMLALEKDTRKSTKKIADLYCWHPLYHIHDIIRQHYTNGKLSSGIRGTIIILPALPESTYDDFDYLDNINSKVMMIKMGEIVILAVLDDSRFCYRKYRNFLGNITGSLNSVQIRELFARLRYLNMNIKRRPEFYSFFNEEGYQIKARVPNRIELYPKHQEKVSLFSLMRQYIEELIPPDLPWREQLISDLEQGRAQFILDENFRFFQHKPQRIT